MTKSGLEMEHTMGSSVVEEKDKIAFWDKQESEI